MYNKDSVYYVCSAKESQLGLRFGKIFLGSYSNFLKKGKKLS